MIGIKFFQKATEKTTQTIAKDPVRATQNVLGGLGMLGFLGYAGNEYYKVLTEPNTTIKVEGERYMPIIGMVPRLIVTQNPEEKPSEEIQSSIKSLGSSS